MNLLDKAKCKLGTHNGEWDFVDENSCLQKQICLRCGKTSNRTAPHNWQNWTYDAEGQCTQRGHCQRCKAIEIRTEHKWADIYIDDISCKIKRACSRCGEKQPGVIALIQSISEKHAWNLDSDAKWPYTADNACTTFRICEHCKQKEYKQMPHPWTEWTYTSADPHNCSQIRTCQRCGKIEKTVNHTWNHATNEDWPFTAENECTRYRVCLRCDKQEIKQIPHRFGEWHFAFPEMRSCIQHRNCLKCSFQETRQAHTWEPNYINTPDRLSAALQKLINAAKKKDEDYEIALTLQNRLKDNEMEIRRFGVNSMLQHDRYQILAQIDRLTLSYLNKSFDELTELMSLSLDPLKGKYRIEDSETGKPTDICMRCGDIRIHEEVRS